MSTTVAWKILTRLDRRISSAADVSNVAFSAEPNPGIFTQFSLPLSHAYVPLALIPTATYHQVLRNRLQQRGIEWPSKKPPYSIPMHQVGESLLSMKFRVYPPNILAMTLRLKISSDTRLENDFSRLLNWRFPMNIQPIREVVNFTAGIISSGDHRRPKSDMQLTAYTGYHLQPVATREAMRSFQMSQTKQLTALLLGIRHWREMSEDLLTNVRSQNEELNKKDTGEILLLNKQGLLLLTPSVDSSSLEVSRFDRALDLVEIGRAFQYFLDDFSHIRLSQEDFADYILAQIEAWLKRPAAIWASSYSGQLAWSEISRAFRLSEKFSLVTDSHPRLAGEIMEKREFFSQAADHWWEKPAFASIFDSTSFRATSVLTRIDDPELKQNIVSYLREAEVSLAGRSFKAAVIMAGSAVEAMLLAALERDTTLDQRSLRTKGLKDYIQLTKAHDLVHDTALLDLLDTSLREWRNLVHPGRALRTGVNLTEDHATITVTAANALAKIL